MGSGEQEHDVKPKGHATGRRTWRWAGVVVGLIIFGWTLARLNGLVGKDEKPSGFGQGLWHGAVMPCALPLLVLGRDVVIYAPLNTGRTYKIGYTLGVNGCGLIFFGLFFRRLRRWKRD